jgi:hypothetical protein
VRLTLIGTEQPLTLPLNYVFLQAAEVLNTSGCHYCRLIYTAQFVGLEAIITAPNMEFQEQKDWVRSAFEPLVFTVSCLGGVLKTQTGANQKVIQFLLKLPYPTLSWERVCEFTVVCQCCKWHLLIWLIRQA